MTILRAQVEANERGLCCCGQRATSELSYAEDMDQRQDASSPSPPSSPPTDGSYQTPVTELVTRLVPVPEDVQLPSPTSSEEEAIPIPPPRATTPGRDVSGQRCWTRCKFDKTPGAGASKLSRTGIFHVLFALFFLKTYEHYPSDSVLSSSPHSF